MKRKKKKPDETVTAKPNFKRDGVGYTYNFDGEIHEIDSECCYALTAFEYDGDIKKQDVRVHDTKKQYCKKFAEYIMKVDPEMAIKMLTEIVEKKQPLNMAFIVKDSSMNPLINQLTIGLKFSRLPRDSIYFEYKEKLKETCIENP